MRRYLGGVAAALLTLGTLAPCAFAQSTTGPNVMFLLKLAGDNETLSRIGSCLSSRLSRMPDVEIATRPSNNVRFIVDIVAANDRFASLVVAETFPVEQYRLRIKDGEDSDALLAGIRSYTLLRLLVPGRSRQALCASRNWRQGFIQGIHRAGRLIGDGYRKGSSTMFDAKSMLDTILGGQAAEQTIAVAQSAHATLTSDVYQPTKVCGGLVSAKR
jgi:hypothetical protein